MDSIEIKSTVKVNGSSKVMDTIELKSIVKVVTMSLFNIVWILQICVIAKSWTYTQNTSYLFKGMHYIT